MKITREKINEKKRKLTSILMELWELAGLDAEKLLTGDGRNSDCKRFGRIRGKYEHALIQAERYGVDISKPKRLYKELIRRTEERMDAYIEKRCEEYLPKKRLKEKSEKRINKFSIPYIRLSEIDLTQFDSSNVM